MVYLVVGPPLFAALAIVFSIFATMLGYSEFRPAAFDSFPRALLLVVGSLPFSYALGGIQALVVGFGASLWKRFCGSEPIAVPLVLAAMVWPLYLGIEGFVKETYVGPLSPKGLLLLANHLVVAAICWWITVRR